MAGSNSSSIRVALDLVASASGAASISSLIYAFSSLGGQLQGFSFAALAAGDAAAMLVATLAGLSGAAADMMFFDSALKLMVTDAANLQYTQAQMDFALHGTQQQIDQLNPKIIEWADNSIYTTAQIHQLVAALSQHGLDVTQIMNGDAQAAINLAEAIGVDPVDAANLLASTLQIFSSQSLNATDASNMLTAAFYNGVPSVESLRTAFDQAGGRAVMMGVKARDLAANIDLLSQAGLDATSSGSGLNYLLQTIADPTTKAANAFNYLGLTVVNKTSPALRNLEADLNRSGAAGQGVVKQFDGTSVGLNNMFKAAQKLGLIPLNETFNEWAISSGAMSSKLFDSKGNLISLGNTVEQIIAAIQAKAHGNKELMATLLGEMFNVRSSRAIGLLADMTDYKSRYNKILGEMGATSSAKDATKLVDTLSGSWKELNTTFTSFMATAGAPLLGWLTSIVKDLNTFISGLMKGNPVVMQFITIFTVVGAVLATLAVIVGVLAVAFFVLDGALLPIIIIVLAVAVGIAILAAIITGIILLVMHWGQVSHWLQEQWKRFTDWLGSNVHKALQAVGGWFSWLGEQAKEKWNQLVSWVQGIWNNFTSWIGNAAKNVVNTVVGWFEWLYNHNYYFHDLVEGIKREFEFAKQIVQNVWKFITGYLAFEWAVISGTAKAVWNAIVFVITSVWHGLQRDAHTIWTGITTSIQNDIKILQTIGGWINDHVIKPIKKIFSDLWNDAISWGSNLIKMFVQGVEAGLNTLKTSLGNVANSIKNILGFHSPAKEGPGSDADTWAPNLMRMFTLGIVSGTPALQSAALNAAGAVRTGLTGGAVPGMQLAGQAGGNTTVTVQVGNEPLFQMVMDRLTGQLQVNGFARSGR